jgi:hypothetical protein
MESSMGFTVLLADRPGIQKCVRNRVGRVLVRKLVLRGYKVVVLARDLRDVAQNLPSSVVMVEGDLKDPEAIRKAVEGADKVPFCSFLRRPSMCFKDGTRSARICSNCTTFFAIPAFKIPRPCKHRLAGTEQGAWLVVGWAGSWEWSDVLMLGCRWCTVRARALPIPRI